LERHRLEAGLLSRDARVRREAVAIQADPIEAFKTIGVAEATEARRGGQIGSYVPVGFDVPGPVAANGLVIREVLQLGYKIFGVP